MRTLRRNQTPLYLCKQAEVDGMTYFKDPVKIMVNNNVIMQSYMQNETGVEHTIGQHSIVYDKNVADIAVGDVLYYEQPVAFDGTAYDADLIVQSVFEGLNSSRATVKEKWR